MVIVSLLTIRRTVTSLMRWDCRVCLTSMHGSTTVLYCAGGDLAAALLVRPPGLWIWD